MVKLSPRTADLVSRLLAPADVSAAMYLLRTGCADNLPLIRRPDPMGLERIRFAALRASQGDLAKLRQMIELAQVDWRDLLMIAGFGHSTEAHVKWAESVLEQRGDETDDGV